jgi:hypothetical protein
MSVLSLEAIAGRRWPHEYATLTPVYSAEHARKAAKAFGAA